MADMTSGSGTVHIVECMAPGGIETLVLDLVRKGHSDDRIISLSGETKALVDNWPDLAPETSRIEAFGRQPGVHPGLIGRIACHLRRIRPRAVVVHHIGPLLYGGIAAKLAGVKRLVHVEHDVWHYRKHASGRYISAVCGRVLRPRYVAISDAAADVVRSIIPSATVTVIPPAIDTDRFRPADKVQARLALGLDPGCHLIGNVGRLVPEKAQDALIRCLPDLPSNVQLAIVGDGEQREALLREAAACGVNDRVHLLGHRSDVDVLLPAFDVFCLPSTMEGLPRSVLEAQSCGVPVVASNVGALSDAICPLTGRLVSVGDKAQLVAAIEDVLAANADPVVSRQFVESRFSWSQTVEAYRAVTES